ncbi:MAG: hypothetical protein NTV51_29145 [Verrucomicrobia bacterium]|nr:hypothetical protein [Verrucomicrobiota bacterium]
MNPLAPWKVIFSLTVVVLASGAVGAGVALRIQNARTTRAAGPGPALDLSAERLAVALVLTPDQKIKIRPLLDRAHRDIRTITAGAVAQSAQVGQQLEQEIRPLLDADQWQRLQQMTDRRKRLRERWQNGERLTPEQRVWLRDRLDPRNADRTAPASKP